MAGVGAEATEDLVGRGADDGSMLTDVEAGADEFKDAHLSTQPKKIAVGDGSIAMASQTGIDEIEIAGQLLCRSVGSTLLVERRGQAPPDKGELAPVGFLARARIQRRRIVVELRLVPLDRVGQLRTDRRQTGGLTEISRQRPYPFPVKRQQRAALKVQSLRQHRGVGIRVAILIASNPRPEADQRIHLRPQPGVRAGQRLGQLFLDIRNRVEEGPLQVEEGIPNLVEQSGAEGPNLVRVPQNLDLSCDPLPHPFTLSGRQRSAQPRQLLADAVLVIEDAASNCLGWMRS